MPQSGQAHGAGSRGFRPCREMAMRTRAVGHLQGFEDGGFEAAGWSYFGAG